MNLAEDKRNARIVALDDGKLLELVLRSGELSEMEVHAFADMRSGLENFEVESGGGVASLSKRQRAWLEEVARRVLPVDGGEAWMSWVALSHTQYDTASRWPLAERYILCAWVGESWEVWP